MGLRFAEILISKIRPGPAVKPSPGPYPRKERVVMSLILRWRCCGIQVTVGPTN